MVLSRSLAETVIEERVGRPLGMGVQDAASLICLTIEQNMVAAIEEITVRRGVDPREFVLVSGGSAAGLHAAAIARELGMRRVIVSAFRGGIERIRHRSRRHQIQFCTKPVCDDDPFRFTPVSMRCLRTWNEKATPILIA